MLKNMNDIINISHRTNKLLKSVNNILKTNVNCNNSLPDGLCKLKIDKLKISSYTKLIDHYEKYKLIYNATNIATIDFNNFFKNLQTNSTNSNYKLKFFQYSSTFWHENINNKVL